MLLTSAAAVSAAPPPVERGIALGLFAEDPGFSYLPLLREIAATGATHVSVIVPYYQHDVGSMKIYPHPRYSPPDRVVQQTLRQARSLGLKVLLFPILRLEYKVTSQEWRGSIQPRDPDAWWSAYGAFLLKFARMAAAHGCVSLCVGSELGSMDRKTARWRPLLRQVRVAFSGKLVYSANWDGYQKTAIWPLVDQAGLSAYFELTAPREKPTLERLIHAWREHRVRISRWRARINKPLLITELGYHSQQGTSARPWDETAARPLSLGEQAAAYRAFIRVWSGVRYLRGVYFWNWFGWGGPRSREYCPRGKPAAAQICSWFGARKCPGKVWGMPWRRRSE